MAINKPGNKFGKRVFRERFWRKRSCLFLLMLLAATARGTEVADTKFAFGRGYYGSAFTDTIKSATPDAIITYTLDGSDPRTSPSAVSAPSPAAVNINPRDDSKRPLTPAVILRAYAHAAGLDNTNVDTQTYFFIEQVKTQSAESPGRGWPQPVPVFQNRFWRRTVQKEQVLDFGMDPDVVNHPLYKGETNASLLFLPSLSLVTDLKHLFSRNSGIYVNADKQGADWERPASLELLYPNGKAGFQVNTGIRIRGGYSRIATNGKHAFRFFFRKKYGDVKLNYPLFEREGVSSFDKVDLRTAQNYSWSLHGDTSHTFLRDVFCRDMQKRTGQPYTRSRYYHLYLNGLYWGVFQTQERSDARYAASYFGGNREDYDVVKSTGLPGGNTVEATDGNLDLYRELFEETLAGLKGNAAYFRLLGLKPDGSPDSLGKILLDPENLIDYMLTVFFTGDKDSPISFFLKNAKVNNFYGIINRKSPEGFKWFRHDCEHTLDKGLNDRTGPYTSPNFLQLKYFNPQFLHQELMANPEYRTLFADRAHLHLFNGGAMTPESNIAALKSRAAQVEGAMLSESARWGDQMARAPLTPDKNWRPVVNRLLENYLPNRTRNLVAFMIKKGVYPPLAPPVCSTDSGIIPLSYLNVQAGASLTLTDSANSGGTIFYTLDGTDPRAIGGRVSPNAINGKKRGKFAVSGPVLKTRILKNAEWSPLRQINFIYHEMEALKITEIHYHPTDNVSGGDTINDREYEFLELKNTGTQALNLSGVGFSRGIRYTFPVGTVIGPGRFVVLSSNPAEFEARYHFRPFGHYLGQLNNAGESIVLVDAAGMVIDSVKYSDDPPWPISADGKGQSLSPAHPDRVGNPNLASTWKGSAAIHGSPGVNDGEAGFNQAVPKYSSSLKITQLPNKSIRIVYTVMPAGPWEMTIRDTQGRRIQSQSRLFRQDGAVFSFVFSGLVPGIFICTVQHANGKKSESRLFPVR